MYLHIFLYFLNYYFNLYKQLKQTKNKNELPLYVFMVVKHE